ncbi:carboxypeptidase-like regulatory domain-containing protein [Belliella sp. R4-6]|uniref:Carboxypeptidase-like regulatory domain-containing protein n=1 Tax=Belliella alkalica TaxID=1730871 RepID=A0ABS9VHF4_9BACT|nr:carboxypeptidase-like regulatory domain-containing protein [Belliella alkalica]MCH7415584.1 carboxypeptidase-like regulatory domain-containing protein [Belliella alkalica]
MKFTRALLTVLFFFNFSISYCQITLKGIVENAENLTPIPYAMVFLTNTSIGTVSDSVGKFTLDIPDGKHELIIKTLGFLTLNFEFDHNDIQKRLYRFQLVADDMELSELEVNSVRDKAWYSNLEIFKRYFIGTSSNSFKTTLKNPTKLILDDQSIPRTLLAKANEAIEIENINLGYRIKYILQSFEYSKSNFRVFYGGYALFTSDSTLSRRKQKQVEKNRETAYFGSSMHFLRAVYQNKVEEEGFLVRRLRKIPNINRPDEEELNAVAENFRLGRPTPYTFEEYARLKKLPKTIDTLDEKPIDLSNFIEESEDGKKILKFEDYLQVIYQKAKPDQNYPNANKLTNQESLIHFINGKIEIYENGSFSPPYDLLFEGYMGWVKIGDMLPLDYYPNDSK